MLTWTLGFLSIVFLTPALLFSLIKKTNSAPTRFYGIATLGVVFHLSYLFVDGLWPIAMTTISHLILYYFGISAVIAYRKSKAVLPAIINVCVLSFMILVWVIMLIAVDTNSGDKTRNIILIEGVLTALVILISTLPIISLAKPVVYLSKVWPFISWSIIIAICYLSEAWIGVSLYSFFLLVILITSVFSVVNK